MDPRGSPLTPTKVVIPFYGQGFLFAVASSMAVGRVMPSTGTSAVEVSNMVHAGLLEPRIGPCCGQPLDTTALATGRPGRKDALGRTKRSLER